MKWMLPLLLAAALATPLCVYAQSDAMKGMDMKDKQGMDMMTKDTKAKKGSQTKGQAQVHKGSGTVTSVDKAAGSVTIAHGPIATMKWPAMSMTFAVKDNALLDKLSSGQKVEFEFTQQGKDYYVIGSAN